MRIDIKETQRMVNSLRKEIRSNTGIILEEIVIRKADFREMELTEDSRTNFVIGTERGIILVDPNRSYNPEYVSLEYAVLHELGHRAQEAINPEMHLDMIENIAGIKLRNRSILMRPIAFAKIIFSNKELVDVALSEGLADCFAIDIFPEYCTLPEQGLKMLAKHKLFRELYIHDNRVNDITKRTSKAYNFFSKMHEKYSLPGIVSYVRHISGHKLPSFKEMEEAEKFLRHGVP